MLVDTGLPDQMDQILADGDVLPILGGIEIIHTPGHTAGHICLYLSSHKLLIAGDMFNADQGRLVFSPVFTRIDPTTCQTSLEKLTAYNIQTVLCYHGGLAQGYMTRVIAELAAENDYHSPK